eukprot:4849359-Pyramimonas_sp.AAC.1
MVSADIAKACEQPRVLEKWTPRPHHTVRVDMAAHPRQHMQLVMRSPKAFPRAHPSRVGCHPLQGPPEDRGYTERVQEDARR